LVDVEAVAFHEGPPLKRAARLRPYGGERTGPGSSTIKRHALARRAAGAEMHDRMEEASRVDREAEAGQHPRIEGHTPPVGRGGHHR
jgi:hypothetical protein